MGRVLARFIKCSKFLLDTRRIKYFLRALYLGFSVRFSEYSGQLCPIRMRFVPEKMRITEFYRLNFFIEFYVFQFGSNNVGYGVHYHRISFTITPLAALSPYHTNTILRRFFANSKWKSSPKSSNSYYKTSLQQNKRLARIFPYATKVAVINCFTASAYRLQCATVS